MASAQVQSNPTSQDVKQSVVDGPVAQGMKNQADKTTAEFQDLANARTTPEKPAATGQPLTHYHSMLYRLLSWRNPRATAITFAANVLLIFAARYLNILRYAFKILYLVLGVAATAEIAGRTIFGNGLATQMRPRRYFVIPRDSLERFTDDFEQLVNFVVIEFQRIVFVENLYVTVGAFLSAFLAYFLIKWLPLWGLTLLATCVAYLAPLVYLQNKEFIDTHLQRASTIVADQAHQMRTMATERVGEYSDKARSVAGQYTAKAQEYMGGARPQTNGNGPAAESTSTGSAKTKTAPVTTSSFTKAPTAASAAPATAGVAEGDFPAAPKVEPLVPVVIEDKNPAPAEARQEPLASF